jgi:transcriptional regulator with XRE-family HTH domain
MTNDPKSITGVDASVGARIRARRMLLGMSQTELGRSSGVTFQQIQKYENGTNRISVSRLHEIAGTLDVPIDFFFEGVPGRKAVRDGTVDPAPLLAGPEAIALLKAFRDIADAKVRHGLVALAKQLAKRKRDGRPALRGSNGPAVRPKGLGARRGGSFEPQALALR